MNTLKNSVRLIGNLGQNPEVKTFDGNKKVAKFSIATSESYKNAKGERVTDTQWHSIVAWGYQAGVAEKFLKKGCEVALEGKLTTRSYTDKNGVRRYVTEVQANEILLVKDRG